MGVRKKSFKRCLLAASISSCMFASAGSYAQNSDEAAIEEVVITGIRSSIATSISTKRDAATIVEAITAEDIGKLPDVTISDSLQRISGVQIRRQAGEGGAVNIRGLPQVVTQLNGEQYLGAGSVVNVQPSFGDIPAQLFKGADVYKAAESSLGHAGITGTINLKTYRPFDFDEGVTTAGSAEIQTGSETGEADPVLSGLFNWQNEKIGFLFSAAVGDVNLANSYNGINASTPGDGGWTGQQTFEQLDHDRDGNFARTADGTRIQSLDGDGNGVVDGDGNPVYDPIIEVDGQGQTFVGGQGFAAWNQVTERKRTGISSSFQADLGEGFIFTTDVFYSSQDEYNRMVGLSATNKWQSEGWINPTDTFETGTNITGYTAMDISPRRVKSFTQNESWQRMSRNVNVQLDYDNEGAFTGSFRAVMGKAKQAKRHGYNEGDLTNGQATLGRTTNFLPEEYCTNGEAIVGSKGGCFQEINPLGYGLNPEGPNPDGGTFGSPPSLHIDNSGSHPLWSGFDSTIEGGLGTGADAKSLATYMGNLASYNVGAFSSENNENASGELTAVSIKGRYSFFGDSAFVTSIDAGIRSGQRSSTFERYNLFSPFHNEGCEAQWKATDVLLNAGPCQDGELIDGEFEPYAVLGHVGLDEYNNVIQVSDFGPVSGIPAAWAIDPKDYDDPKAFHDRVFGSTVKHILPGNSFSVDMDDLTYFVQANFEKGDLIGNLGVRVVDTTLTVRQNIGGANRAYGNTQIDVGDTVTTRSYSDVLPALNLSYQLTGDVMFRFAYSEAMTPLNLDQYGDGLTLNTALDSEVGSPTEGQFIVSGGSLNGNPNLNPWRSTNIDVSAEWYLADVSMLSIGLFSIDIDSFVSNGSELQWQPDADGVVRRQVQVSLNTQGAGGTLEGIELSGKITFSDFLDEDSLFSNFGIDANLTLSPSENGFSQDIFGSNKPFPDNSERQYNVVGWYDNERFQARLAYNYRSDRLDSEGVAGGSLDMYQKAVSYVDVSASYDVLEDVTVYLNGSNITGSFEEYYIGFESQYGSQNYYEPRYTLGVRAKF